MNPQTGGAHPPQRIENAIVEARYNFDPIRSVEKQVEDIVRKIRPLIPISFEKVKAADFEVGYNASTNELVNMFDTGIIDPAKVTRSTLQNAASIASMVLTTECIIVDKKEIESVK